MADKTGVARLRQAIKNQRDLGNGDFRLTYHDADEIADEIEEEYGWAAGVPAPKDADGDGSRWVREDVSPKIGAPSPIASPVASRSAELARRLMVHELRHAATGAYRHVCSLDVIAGAIGVDAEGKYEHDIEREVYARLADIIEGSVNALTGPRKRTRKIKAYLVADFGGSFGSAWEDPVTAFTDHEKARVCRYIREQRRVEPSDGVLCPIDYLGTCVKRIEVVIDE